MILNTKHFGEISYEETDVYCFPEALPGFLDHTRYLVIQKDELFCWLQSIDDPNLAFALMNVYEIIPDYNPITSEDEVLPLGDMGDSGLIIYNIAVIPEEIKKMRVNLRAPIVINTKTKLGKQVILNNEDYDVRHYIFEELERFREQ